MKRYLLCAIFLCVPFSAAAQSAPQTVNPHASPEARALLAYIDSISGKGIITGQHNYPNDESRWTDRTLELTGKYPGLFGQDFGFSGGEDKDSALSRPGMIEEAERQWANGSIIALTWHAVRPTDDEPVTFHDSVQGHLTDYEWHELLTPGTPLYNRWCEQVDVIAGYLRQLREAHVPVLFRPYHEMNGSWFWWGGRPGHDGSAAIYRQLYDRYVNKFHLDNLVWVWNVNAPGGSAGPVADYFPGADFADLASIDIYGEFKQEYYDSMLALAAGKPIALAEVGEVPSLDVLAKQPRWAYFMVWSGFLDANRMGLPQALYDSPLAITRNDPRQAGPLTAIRHATAEVMSRGANPDPVSPDAGAGARDRLSLLAARRNLVSGQQLDEMALKSPLPKAQILAFDASSSAKDIIATLWNQPKTGRQQWASLTWRPGRPTGGGPAKSQLTDFEWNELLTPGSGLNKLWAAQVDELAKSLRAFQDANQAVMFDPYPESNGKDYWWAGRKGIHGSAALYRMLFDRLIRQDGLRTMVWVWEAAPPSFGAGSTGPLSDYFPGLLYTDALELRTSRLNPRYPADRMLAAIAPGKPVGVELAGEVPEPDALFGQSQWSWFIVDAAPETPERAEALRKLFADPRVLSMP